MTRETALRIVKAFRDYRPAALGIEKGMAKEAVVPYLSDEMNRLDTFFEVVPLSHGNQKKQDRIQWALQGRAEKGRIQLLRGDWNKEFLPIWISGANLLQQKCSLHAGCD